MVRCNDTYSSIVPLFILQESEVGEAFAERFGKTLKREDIFVTSKLWNTSHEPSRVRPAVEHTLKLLGLAYLDLYLIHWPMDYQYGDGKTLFPMVDVRTHPPMFSLEYS